MPTLRTILGLFVGMAAVARFDSNQVVSAEAVQSPIHFRFNTDLIAQMSLVNDFRIL